MRQFTTKPKPDPEPVQFAIDDREMEFRMPGWAPILFANTNQLGGLTRVYLDWLGAGLSDEDGQWLLDRLMDPEDDFDISEVSDIIFGLIEEVTGRPIELPSDSGASEPTNGSTDGQRRKALTQRT